MVAKKDREFIGLLEDLKERTLIDQDTKIE